MAGFNVIVNVVNRAARSKAQHTAPFLWMVEVSLIRDWRAAAAEGGDRLETVSTLPLLYRRAAAGLDGVESLWTRRYIRGPKYGCRTATRLR